VMDSLEADIEMLRRKRTRLKIVQKTERIVKLYMMQIETVKTRTIDTP
jgi:hypothetical protein